MTIPHYFLVYLLLLLASTIVITGWYLTTRGEEEKMPDGTVERNGNIFRAWYFFWTQKKPKAYNKKYYYDRGNLEGVIRQIADRGRYGIKITAYGDLGAIFCASPSFEDEIPFLESNLGVKFDTEVRRSSSDGLLYIRVYRQDPIYRFPWWVRKMMASCITCHASIYGTIIFVLFHYLFANLLRTEMYGFAPDYLYHPAIFFTWIAYTFSLAYTLTFAYKKL